MRQLRAVHGLSQETLAHESGIDRTYVSSIERAKREKCSKTSAGARFSTTVAGDALRLTIGMLSKLDLAKT